MGRKREFYRIMRLENGKVKTLFHGVGGSRAVPFGEWLEAEKKENVIDGSGGTPYTSGFHVIEGYENVLAYLKNFRKKEEKVIVKCEAEGLVPKSHSRSESVYLADRMKLNRIVGEKTKSGSTLFNISSIAISMVVIIFGLTK